MLRAAVNANSGRWDKLPKALDDLKWLRDRADELADHRNDAVHAPCSIYILDWGAEMGPAYFAAANPRVKNLNAKNLKGKQLIAEFDWCEKYAWTLIGFLQKLEKPIALPDRGLIGPKAAAQGKAVTSAGHSLMAPQAAKTSATMGSRSRSGCGGRSEW